MTMFPKDKVGVIYAHGKFEGVHIILSTARMQEFVDIFQKEKEAGTLKEMWQMPFKEIEIVGGKDES